MKLIVIIFVLLLNAVNAQNIKQHDFIYINFTDSGDLFIDTFNVSNKNITLNALDLVFQAKHYRSSFTKKGLAYFKYPKLNLKVFCFVENGKKHALAFIIPLYDNRSKADVKLLVDGIALNSSTKFDEIYFNTSFQQMIDKEIYRNPDEPNRSVIVMCNSNGLCLELSFKDDFLNLVWIDVNSNVDE